MNFKLAAGGLMAAAFLTAPALAETSYNPDRVIKSVENDDLVAIVKSLDHEVAQVSSDDSRMVAGRDENGLVYVLLGTACDAAGVSGCQGVNMQVRWDLPEGTTAANVARANLERAAISTWMLEDSGTLGFSRYVVLDYGVTMANLRENVKVLLDVMPYARKIATGEE
jgi:hypothetical protein